MQLIAGLPRPLSPPPPSGLSCRWVAAFQKPDTDPSAWEKPATTVLSPYLKFGCLSARLFHQRLLQVSGSRVGGAMSLKCLCYGAGDGWWQLVGRHVGWAVPTAYPIPPGPRPCSAVGSSPKTRATVTRLPLSLCLLLPSSSLYEVCPPFPLAPSLALRSDLLPSQEPQPAACVAEGAAAVARVLLHGVSALLQGFKLDALQCYLAYRVLWE